MNQQFLRPRLVGGRFDEHTVPLEVLKDFAALEEMVIEIAKRRYLASNPHRVRIPRDFTKGLELHLTAVEEGSAVPVIALVHTGLFPSPYAAYLEQARDSVIDAIVSAEIGETPALAPDLLRYFDRFGRALRAGEAIEFSSADGRTSSLTQETRERLLCASQAEEWTEEVVLKGRIAEVDQADMAFEVELRDGTKLKAPLAEQHREAVLEAFNAYRFWQLVAVQGVIKRDRSHHARGFESIEHITLLDPLDIETRLEELAHLQPGWLDGKRGPSFDVTQLKALAHDFDRFFDPDLPFPHLYPTAEGRIQAEWSCGPWEISLEIDPATRTAEYQALHADTQQSKDLLFSLSADENEWAKFNETLREAIRSGA